MDTALIRTYKFEELEGQAKERAREFASPHWDWYTDTLDNWKADLENERGYTDPILHFSGFCSQGDGAAISAKVYPVEWIEANGQQSTLPLLIEHQDCLDSCVTVKQGRDPHWLSLYIDHDRLVYLSDEEMEEDETLENRLEREVETLEQCVLDDLRELSRKLYYELRDEYESMLTDEYIAEHCEANEYRFAKNGKPIHHLLVTA